MDSLQARVVARNALKTVPALAARVYGPEDARPTDATLYARLTVISSPPVNDWGGELAALVRVQVDVYSRHRYDSEALNTAEAARKAMEAAGFTRVGSGQPLTFEGPRDEQQRLFWRVSMDFQTLA